jgi:hypothetical protein
MLDYEEYWASDSSAKGREIPAPGSSDAEAIFSDMLARITDVRSVIDVGAGEGRFLLPLAEHFPLAHLSALEINPTAARGLLSWVPTVHECSILDFDLVERYDLVMAMGLLSCIPFRGVIRAYQKLGAMTGRYLLVRDYAGGGTQPHSSGYPLFRRNYGIQIPHVIGGLKLIACKPETADPVTPSQVSWWLFERVV